MIFSVLFHFFSFHSHTIKIKLPIEKHFTSAHHQILLARSIFHFASKIVIVSKFFSKTAKSKCNLLLFCYKKLIFLTKTAKWFKCVGRIFKRKMWKSLSLELLCVHFNFFFKLVTARKLARELQVKNKHSNQQKN